tara:strand:+ start:966 stop:1340 length:375 start_codon:yes stop_codon:yes gene_type:complete
MPIVQIQLSFSGILNVSAQVGDMIYFTSHSSPLGGFSQASLSGTSLLGSIVNISADGNVTIEYNNDPWGGICPLQLGDFISFAKDKSINTSSLLGHYASVNFVNDSPNKIELFSVGSDISESSK